MGLTNNYFITLENSQNSLDSEQDEIDDLEEKIKELDEEFDYYAQQFEIISNDISSNIEIENLENQLVELDQILIEETDVWKTIEDYPDYQISSQGRVKKIKTGKILKINVDSNGYYLINLCKNKVFKTYSMHRIVAKHFISNPQQLKNVDHINNDKLDNRIGNLRWVTNQQNRMNQLKTKKPTSSIYKGVFLIKKYNLWKAQIKINKKKFYLGQFQTQEEAALAYNAKAIELFGEFAKLNIISQ
uniref:Endonuclease n=1 Tax=Tetrahymena thermophila TaxID=5911 RepID=Q8WRC3_TETTH|nr:endonuclease [Tetrahymena thermophila]